MSEEAIRKLRLKFMIYAMLSLSIVMFLMAGLIYVTNVIVARKEVRETMDYITRHEGVIQDAVTLYNATVLDDGEQQGSSGNFAGSADGSRSGASSESSVQGNSADQDNRQNSGLSASEWDELKGRLSKLNENYRKSPYDISEFLNDVFGSGDNAEDILESEDDSFSTRYFAVIYDNAGEVLSIKANHISALTTEDATTLGDYARHKFFKFGQYGKYYYQVSSLKGDRLIVIFLDSSNQIHATARLLYSAMLFIAFGVSVTFFIVRIFSGKAIAPEIRNAELQKEFITNASHELKTPLAVIRANAEMQEILNGENEWTQSTLRQVDRLNGLIQNLVVITRAQETETEERMTANVAVLIADTAKAYLPVATQEGKTLEICLPESITLKAVDSEIRQLATLLIDNAIKYCDDKGTIRIEAGQKGREVWLVVSNSYEEGANVDYEKFFERFYRQNEAHTINSGKEQKGGYGIGLSIAEKLVKKYNGSIKADWKDGVIYFTCTLR